MARTSVIDLYERLTTAPDERARARVIAEAFEMLDDRYPQLHDMVTTADLRHTELTLLKAIADVQLQTEQVRAELKIDIEQLRAELKTDIEQLRVELRTEVEQLKFQTEQVRAELKNDIEQVRAELKTDIEKLRAELKTDLERTRANILLWSFGFWITQFAAIMALLWRL